MIPNRCSHSLPSTIVDIRLQFPRNRSRGSLLQPNIPVQCIVPLLIKEKLSPSSKSRVRLAVFVQIGRRVEAAVLVVQVEHAAFADVEEETCVDAASVYSLMFVPA